MDNTSTGSGWKPATQRVPFRCTQCSRSTKKACTVENPQSGKCKRCTTGDLSCDHDPEKVVSYFAKPEHERREEFSTYLSFSRTGRKLMEEGRLIYGLDAKITVATGGANPNRGFEGYTTLPATGQAGGSQPYYTYGAPYGSSYGGQGYQSVQTNSNSHLQRATSCDPNTGILYNSCHNCVSKGWQCLPVDSASQ